MGIPLLAGSGFARLRDEATPAQAIVNEEFVRRFVGAGEPIGRRLTVAQRRRFHDPFLNFPRRAERVHCERRTDTRSRQNGHAAAPRTDPRQSRERRTDSDSP
jgi:hypothetical protein